MSRFLTSINGWKQVFDTSQLNFKGLKDEDVKYIFRCSDEELRRLEQALGDATRNHTVNGVSLDSQNLRKLANASAIIDGLWSNLEKSDKAFKAMLTGTRWKDPQPLGLDVMITKAKDHIRSRHENATKVGQGNAVAKIDQGEVSGASSTAIASGSNRLPQPEGSHMYAYDNFAHDVGATTDENSSERSGGSTTSDTERAPSTSDITRDADILLAAIEGVSSDEASDTDE